MMDIKKLQENFNTMLENYGLDKINFKSLTKEEANAAIQEVINKFDKDKIKELSEKVNEMQLAANVADWFSKVSKGFNELITNVNKSIEANKKKEENMNKAITNYIDKYIDMKCANNNASDWEKNHLKEILTPFLSWLMKQV